MYLSFHRYRWLNVSKLWISFAVIACALTNLQSTSAQDAEPKSKIVEFQRDVLPILVNRCKECHEGDGAKNGFQVLDRDAMFSYVDETGSESSSLWNDYLLAPAKSKDAESLVMPPHGPLAASELAVLKLWLDEGANWPEGVVTTDGPVQQGDQASTPSPMTDTARVLTAAGFMHPAVVHFPIALIMFSALLVVASYLGGGENAKRVALTCLVFGAIASIFSSVAGWGFAMEKGYTDGSLFPSGKMSEAAATLYRHRWLGISTAAFSTLIAIVAVSSSYGKRSGHFWRLGVIVCAVLVSIVGHQGGEMVYGDTFHKALGRLGWTTSETETVLPAGEGPQDAAKEQSVPAKPNPGVPETAEVSG